MTSIVVIDYGIGNIKSICRALEKSGANVNLTNNHERVLSSDGVVLPGVGAFPHAMNRLQSLGLEQLLHKYANTGRPILGICLGMQMLFDESTEFGVTKGLGLIPGKVQKLEVLDKQYKKLPHMSWSEVMFQYSTMPRQAILSGIQNNENMYFVHSYYTKPINDKDVISTTFYSGFEYCSTVKHKNIYGCQYHPEKSATAGLKIIKNFVDICRNKL